MKNVYVEKQWLALTDLFSGVAVPAMAIHDFLNLLLIVDHFEKAADLNIAYAKLLAKRTRKDDSYNQEFLGAIKEVYFTYPKIPMTLEQRADLESKVAVIVDFLGRYAEDLRTDKCPR